MTTGIALSVTFSDPKSSVLPIVLVSLLVAVFLILEGRRYRFFDIWRTRLRVLETNFYRPILSGQSVRVDNRWNEVLADDYIDVHFHITYLEAIGRRLRRNYCWIFAVQVVSFWGKVGIHPSPLAGLEQLWARTSHRPAARLRRSGDRYRVLYRPDRVRRADPDPASGLVGRAHRLKGKGARDHILELAAGERL